MQQQERGQARINPYDNNGNMLSDGSRSFAWNTRNQLSSVSGAATATFRYDTMGRRISKTVSGTTTQFLYDGLNPIQEKNAANAPTANQLPRLSLDELYSRTETGIVRHLLTDALGSTIALTDSAGTLPTTYTYEPYGETTIAGAANTNSFKYTGREDDGTGLYYYRTQYYNPTLKRFISEDPIGLAGALIPTPMLEGIQLRILILLARVRSMGRGGGMTRILSALVTILCVGQARHVLRRLVPRGVVDCPVI